MKVDFSDYGQVNIVPQNEFEMIFLNHFQEDIYDKFLANYSGMFCCKANIYRLEQEINMFFTGIEKECNSRLCYFNPVLNKNIVIDGFEYIEIESVNCRRDPYGVTVLVHLKKEQCMIAELENELDKLKTKITDIYKKQLKDYVYKINLIYEVDVKFVIK